MTVTAEYNGQTFEFPDEATDEDIDTAMNQWATDNVATYEDAGTDSEWLSSLENYFTRNPADNKPTRNGFDYDSYIETLGLHEGKVDHRAINQNGNLVRAYGVEVIPPGVQNTGDPLQLARDTAQWHVNKIGQHLHENYNVSFDTLPSSVQQMVTDLHYSTGKSFDSVDTGIGSGDYMRAAANSLTIVGLTRAGEKATTGGIAKRRADMFNKVADELGAERISQVMVQDLGTQGTQYTYVGSSGGVVASFVTSRRLRDTQTDANGLRVFAL